jgi:uncharacterized damage-inducible protein DinB
MIDVLRALFNRDLLRLKREMELYRDERCLWITSGAVANSAGNLCLHLIGNLNTYIGAEIGKTGYVRDRDAEFSQRDVPREELIRRVASTIAVVNAALDTLTDADLPQEFPLLVFEQKTSMQYLLVHLATHLTYHLGQINYHRRLLEDERCLDALA